MRPVGGLMTRRRLNGWQRIGVVVSVVWLVLGWFIVANYLTHQADWVSAGYKACEEIRPQVEWPVCEADFHRNWTAAMRGFFWFTLIGDTLPILVGWSLCYALIAIVKWVKSGFQYQDTPLN